MGFGLEGRGEGERDHADEMSEGVCGVRGVHEPLERWEEEEEESVDRDGGGVGGRALLRGWLCGRGGILCTSMKYGVFRGEMSYFVLRSRELWVASGPTDLLG